MTLMMILMDGAIETIKPKKIMARLFKIIRLIKIK